MKHKIVLFVLLAAVTGVGAMWMAQRHSPASATAAAGRKILYYQSAMHPWIKPELRNRKKVALREGIWA
jgi:hypothetical protein